MNEDIFDERGFLKKPRGKTKEKWFEIGKNKVASNISLEIRKGVRYFICVTAPYNYVTCINHNLWGVEPRNKNIIKKTSPRDIILFYIKSEKKFGVVCEITSNVFYDNSPVWKDGIYPYRIQIKPLFSSQYPKKIDQILIENLDFIPRKDNKWGCALQRSMLEISEKDFFTILSYLNDR